VRLLRFTLLVSFTVLGSRGILTDNFSNLNRVVYVAASILLLIKSGKKLHTSNLSALPQYLNNNVGNVGSFPAPTS